MASLPDIETISSLGGFAKKNYQNLPPANPITDFDNTLLGAALGDVAELTQTAPRVIIQMTLASTTGGLVLNNWFANWKNVTPTVPVLRRTSAGIFTITLPSTVSDEYSASVGLPNTHTVNLFSGVGNLEGATSLYSAAVSCVGNIITVNMCNIYGLNDFPGLVLDIWCR
jgi:hypothetical protein